MPLNTKIWTHSACFGYMHACILRHVQLCHPVDCSPPGSSVHGILQARIPEWVAILTPGWSSWSRDRTHISCPLFFFISVCSNLPFSFSFSLLQSKRGGSELWKGGSVCNGSTRINLLAPNPLSTEGFFSSLSLSLSPQIIWSRTQPPSLCNSSKALKVHSRCSWGPSGQKQNKLLILPLNRMKQVWISLFN